MTNEKKRDDVFNVSHVHFFAVAYVTQRGKHKERQFVFQRFQRQRQKSKIAESEAFIIIVCIELPPQTSNDKHFS